MSPRALAPANMAAAAVLIGGVLIVARPEHVLGVAELVLVTIAAGAGLYALAAHVPPTAWMSPFKWMSPFGGGPGPERRRHGSDEIDAIRSKLSDRRQRIAHGPPLPPDVLRLLRPVIADALDIDPDDVAQVAAAGRRLSPLAWSVLASDPIPRSYWLNTLRPNEWEVAEVVHEVLDELEHLPASTSRRRSATAIHHQPSLP